AWKRAEPDLAVLAMVPSFVVSWVAYGIIAVSISEAWLGNEPSLVRSLRYVFRQGLVGALLIVALAQGAALVLIGTIILILSEIVAPIISVPLIVILIIPGLVLLVWLVFSPVVVVLERRSALTSLARSKRLGSGYHWRTAGILSVGLVLFMGGVSLGALAESITANPLVSEVWHLLWPVIFTPIMVSALVLRYYDLRARREGYDTGGLGESLPL
ncbi:MAG TPA: hypothetical protein VH763_07165, partial [Gemmatimonadales bacterium]